MALTLRMASKGSASGGDEPPPLDPPEGQGPDPSEAKTVAIFTGRPRCPVCGERFSRGSKFCAFDGTRLEDIPEDVAADPLVGQTLAGKYTVLRPIGEGGMGTVYEVQHNALDRKFALKVLRPEIAQNAEHMQRFIQEARAAAAIGHPNLVSVSDFGQCEIRGKKVPFFVMEYLKGTSLAALLKTEKKLAPKRCAKIIKACADALAAAHAAGVIHRDLKPDNIFLTGDSSDVVKVLDFGVAKMQGTARLTKIGMVFGTPHYMSPEQARGQPIDHRADIYSLGVILYECLAGRVPFEADTSMGVLTKQIFAKPEPVERLTPDPAALGALGAIVMRCLEKEPDDRFASMDELAAAIKQVIVDPMGAANDALGSSAARHKRVQLKLREETAIPRSVPPPAEPEQSRWTRLVAFIAAAVAVLALVGVSVRALFFHSSSAGSGETAAAPGDSTAAPPIATTAAAPSTSAAPTASPEAPSTPSSSPSETPSSVGRSAPSVSTPGSTGGAPGPSTGAPTTTSARPATTAHSTSSNPVVDPWGTTTKKPKTPPVVVDPWAGKK